MHHYQVGIFTPKRTPSATINTAPATTDQITAGKDIKDAFDSKKTEASVQSDSQNASSANSTSPTTAAVQITTASVDTAALHVRSIIQAIDAKGVCVLTLSKEKPADNTIVSREAQTQTMGSYSTCQGFDISTNALSKGVWKVQLEYKGSQQQTGSTETEVTI